MNPLRLRSLIFVMAAIAAGVLFFSNLDRLWPFVPADMTLDRAVVESNARRILADQGFNVTTHRASIQVMVDEPFLDTLEENFGRERAGKLATEGGIVRYHVVFKRGGDPNVLRADFDPFLRTLAVMQELQEDDPGAFLEEDSAAIIAIEAAREGVIFEETWPDSSWQQVSASSSDLVNRRDYSFEFRRTLSDTPELNEAVKITVAGDRVTDLSRGLMLPAAASRSARTRGAAASDLSTIGFGILGLVLAAALIFFLRELRAGRAEIKRPVILAAVVIGLLWISYPFRKAWIMNAWDPLWPFSSSVLRTFTFAMLGDLGTWVVLFVLVACGDALARSTADDRGGSLWSFCTGRWSDRRVPTAAARGFLIGLFCGGVLAAGSLALTGLTGGRIALQPRGFFLYSMNSSAPFISIAFFFLHTAMLEELGYRYFATAWILRATRSRLLAIALPAIVYGLVHAGYDFLPPAAPAWARVVALACVSMVWGWAFLRFDALTVVLSHWTADIFIFTRPWMISACPINRLAALALMAVPLLPMLAGLIRRSKKSIESPTL